MIHLRHHGYIVTTFPWERQYNNQILNTTAVFGFYCLFVSPYSNIKSDLVREILSAGYYDFFNVQTTMDQSVKDTMAKCLEQASS